MTSTDPSRASSRSRYGRHVSRSAGVGRLAGGAHRTAAATYAPRSRSPSAAWTLVGWLAYPARCRARNTQSPERAPGLHLTDKGRDQAQAVADRLSSLKKVDAVYASPLERTRETAAPIAKAHGLRVRTDRRLLDLDVGDWTGAELKALRKRPE